MTFIPPTPNNYGTQGVNPVQYSNPAGVGAYPQQAYYNSLEQNKNELAGRPLAKPALVGLIVSCSMLLFLLLNIFSPFWLLNLTGDMVYFTVILLVYSTLVMGILIFGVMASHVGRRWVKVNGFRGGGIVLAGLVIGYVQIGLQAIYFGVTFIIIMFNAMLGYW